VSPRNHIGGKPSRSPFVQAAVWAVYKRQPLEAVAGRIRAYHNYHKTLHLVVFAYYNLNNSSYFAPYERGFI